MALKHTLTKDGVTYENAYTRVEVKQYKRDWVVQEYVPATYEAVVVTPAIEATYDADGNELTPAVDAVTEQRELTAEIPEIKEWKSVLRVYSFTYSGADNSKGVKALEELNRGECLYAGGDVAEEAYAYLKTLESFNGAVDA